MPNSQPVVIDETEEVSRSRSRSKKKKKDKKKKKEKKESPSPPKTHGDIEKGNIYEGVVTKVQDFGVFV